MLVLDRVTEGTRLRVQRVALGLHLYQVAQKARVSPARLSEYERNRGGLAPEAAARVQAVLDEATREAGLGGADAVS